MRAQQSEGKLPGRKHGSFFGLYFELWTDYPPDFVDKTFVC